MSARHIELLRTQPALRHDEVAPKFECLATLTPELQRAWERIQVQKYAEAAKSLYSAGHDPSIRNTLGVCLMRLPSVEAAVAVFRSFVIKPGTVNLRPEISGICKRNFATALLMKGIPSGALSVLREMNEPNNPMTLTLYSVIRKWERSLTWWQRLDWKINRIEPANSQILLDFEPGEFDFDFGR